MFISIPELQSIRLSSLKSEMTSLVTTLHIPPNKINSLKKDQKMRRIHLNSAKFLIHFSVFINTFLRINFLDNTQKIIQPEIILFTELDIYFL